MMCAASIGIVVGDTAVHLVGGVIAEDEEIVGSAAQQPNLHSRYATYRFKGRRER